MSAWETACLLVIEESAKGAPAAPIILAPASGPTHPPRPFVNAAVFALVLIARRCAQRDPNIGDPSCRNMAQINTVGP
jgi:hypothetical protein